MHKLEDNRAWFLVIPVFVLVAFNAVVPLMTVVNYSVQDIFGPGQRAFVGVEWFREMLRDPTVQSAFLRQILFSLLVLAMQIPLGVGVALLLPRSGWKSSLAIILVAIPLLVPFNVVGTIWQVYARPEIGLFGRLINATGIDYNYTASPLAAWVTLLLMDAWHWAPLVILLAFAGLCSIPEPYYQAARIDGASRAAVFRFIELPKLRGVLTIAVLLRFMDSFMIYTEPFVVTGGGPGSSTTFLSIRLVNMAVGQFDLGPAAAFSLMYFLVILLFSYVFYTIMKLNNAR
ncbi:sugar ABC transporter permease [Sinirhodobacter ferrireducens]|uniref:Sugar ABC transporter permease n=1 Tax=Paenirhodobacter ferrireducens TaxID=1215032 RepID=A0A443LHL2_9RHOB|nr:sugar ABC transporter permease [Sinirhodobacter ferrireducens]RWR48671.1 sugar ABC transporter permease [Sinirhodobacter ferrireducens]